MGGRYLRILHFVELWALQGVLLRVAAVVVAIPVVGVLGHLANLVQWIQLLYIEVLAQHPQFITSMQSAGGRKYKVIKVFRITKQPNESIKALAETIRERLLRFMQWSWVERQPSVENFLMMPNESIYNEGLRVSYKPRKKLYEMELIKNKWKWEEGSCFCYEYEMSIFYEDPLPMLKSLGYINRQRRSKYNVEVFKSLKFGLEVVLTHFDKDDTADEPEFAKLELIEDGTYSFGPDQMMMPKIEALLKDYLVKPIDNELEHYCMTLKNFGGLEIFT